MSDSRTKSLEAVGSTESNGTQESKFNLLFERY